ncbi:MAG: M14 metallopeptidase family protein [Candidatus Bathyarchaeia archaeon]
MVIEGIPSPEEFFGFRMGADRKLARWDKLVEYYRALDEGSDRIRVTELGKTTEGNPFLLAVITSPENFRSLDDVKAVGPTLAYSEDLLEAEAESMIKDGKAVIAMAMSIHASEVGGAQMAPELAYELVTRDTPEILRILDEVVLLLVPCANPDGNIMVVDWYNKYLGTEYEGVPMPRLYHKYVGHDNNRDLPLMNMPETKMLAKLLFEDWFPIAYIDFHHYGSFGGRYYIPPFVNPTDPEVDPLLWTEQQLYGGAMILKLEQAGKTGVENYAGFTAEFNAAYTRVCTWHGICGMLTESASAKLATPMYVHYHQLQAARRGRPEYRTHVNFPHPWPGGWWRLRDIVEQQKISAYAALEVAANYRETFLRNLRIKALRGIEKGKAEVPYALIFPPNQHDPISILRLLDALIRLGVKIHRAEGEFAVEGATYAEGSYIIFLSQIARPYILSTMRDRIYHESPWVKSPEGAPLDLQDIAGYNMAAMMGANVVEAARPFEVSVNKVGEISLPESSVGASTKHGYVLDSRLNDAFKAVNSLLKRGFKIHRVEEDVEIEGGTLPKGAFYIQDQRGIAEALEAEAKTHNLEFHALEEAPKFKTRELKPQRIAMYQRYYGGNMDEGWTRWLLEQYGFEYSTVKDDEIKDGLQGRYDVLILPSDPTPMITGEKLEEWFEKEFKGMRVPPKFPPEYLSGIGEEGVEKVKEFVENGGTLLLLNQASEFAIEALKMPIINTVKDLKPNEFHCPGSLLKTRISGDSSLAYGVDKGTPLLFWGSPALQIKPIENSGDFDVVVSYPEENILRSGWLIGEKYLSRKAALIEAKLGKGRVVLYGFRSQFRCQTHATLKYLFNALIR